VPIAMLLLPIVRFTSGWVVIRWGAYVVHALGHFALNTELYLCEKDRGINTPSRKFIDLLYVPNTTVSNHQLLKMWRRIIPTYPAAPVQAIEWLNRLIPGGSIHNIGANAHNDRDILNLLVQTKAHLEFTEEEEERGQQFLKKLGIAGGASFICLNVRDAAYYRAVGMANDRQAYRDSSIENYVLAAETMANRGFFVIRMGRKVEAPLKSNSKKIVDYAYDGLGDEFLDLYLGAKCYMCLSAGSGFDAIPAIFRRPVSFVNLLPIETPASSGTYIVYSSRAHYDLSTGKRLTLREIVGRNVVYGVTPERYAEAGIRLEENSPEEIRDVAIETIDRLQGKWTVDPYGEELQRRFREIMPLSMQDSIGRPMHGHFHIRYSEKFLKNNPWWLA
jgi:putative glycosyltransferase (TIGR04372 family)